MTNAALGNTLRQIDRLFGAGTVAGLSDQQLLERFATQRDDAAFAALVERRGPVVLRVCRSVLKDEHAAEDAFQATFMVLARKAPSLQARSTLGGWLYRVAYRIAVEASVAAVRRRGHERTAMALSAQRSQDRNPWHDWLPVLHEEIDRLPERYRAAVVLCDLQEMTYEQAAHELRWTVPTLRCRLARARERLRARLIRRSGTEAGAALTALLCPQPAFVSAVVPGAWARAAVMAATEGTAISTTAAALAAQVLKSMGWTRLKEAATLVLSLGTALTISLIAMSSDRPGPEPPPRNPPANLPRPPMAPAAVPAAERGVVAPGGEPGETVAVRGRVLDPAGKPVAGATIQVDYYLHLTVKPPGGGPSAVSGADGRYTLVAPRDVLERFTRGESRFPADVVASAPGYGPGWAEAVDGSGVLKDVTVRLAADDIPIEGRILDLEGRPVAGAEIVTSEFYDPPGGDLTPWIEEMKANPTGTRGLHDLPFERRRTTGADGRFRLDGVGRERVVMFTVAGPSIALTRTFAMTKDVPPVRSSKTNIIGPRTMIFHGARFDFAVEPCKPVAGLVRDLDTGAPLAGVRVNGMAYEERSAAYYNEIVSITDQQGRYRLLGMAKADRYRLFLFPVKGQPYPTASFVEAAGSPGLELAPIDLRLKRGVLVRGRVTNKATGKPANRVTVESFTSRDNFHAREFPGLDTSYGPRDYTNADGRFEIAALPGRGFIAAHENSDRYLTGVGAEMIKGVKPRQTIPTVARSLSPDYYNTLAEISPEVGSEPVALDLQLDPGRSLPGVIVDPDGKPVSGAEVTGLGPHGYPTGRPLESSTFEVKGLAPRRPRRLDFFHDERELAGSLVLQGDEPGPLTVRLQPWGVVTGRIIDEEGQPRTKLDLVTMVFDSDFVPDRGILRKPYRVDQDGRFRVAVVPGLKYKVYATARDTKSGMTSGGTLFKDLKLGPGEVKDLGNVTLETPMRQ